ncbi:hypothetical protein BGZ83_005179, partial [Gryganskiella cystojenkinii]
IRHDLDTATTAILNLRKVVPDRQPTDEDLRNIIQSVDADTERARQFIKGLPTSKNYDWTSYLSIMEEASKYSGTKRDLYLQSNSVNKCRRKVARALYKRGYLDKNQLSDDERDAFLLSPLIIGVGDGDFRRWQGQSRGGSKFTQNLTKDLARNEKRKSPVIELVKVPEFRT